MAKKKFELNPEAELTQRETEGLSLSAIVRKRFFAHKAAISSLIVLGLITLLAFTSVGVVFGGTGNLITDPNTGRLVLDGIRIPGMRTTRFSIQEGLQLFLSGHLPLASTPSGRTPWVRTSLPESCEAFSSR